MSLRILAKVRITRKVYGTGQEIGTTHSAVECQDRNYWELLDGFNLPTLRYIKKDQTEIIELFEPNEYPEYYL